MKRLRSDSIDSYSVHACDPNAPIEEVVRGRNDLVRPGNVLDVGIADGPAWWIARANALAHLRGRVALQRVTEYSPT